MELCSAEVADFLGVEIADLWMLERDWVEMVDVENVEDVAVSGDALSIIIEADDENLLNEAWGILDYREKKVMSLYYEKSLNFGQIADIFSLTESRISQLHAEIVSKLKGWVEGKKQIAKKGGQAFEKRLDHGYRFLRQVDPVCTPEFDGIDEGRDFVLDKIQTLYAGLAEELAQLEDTDGVLELGKLQSDFARVRWLMILTQAKIKRIFSHTKLSGRWKVNDIADVPEEVEAEFNKRAEEFLEICRKEGVMRITKYWMEGKDQTEKRGNALRQWLDTNDYSEVLWQKLQNLCLYNGVELVLDDKTIPRSLEEKYIAAEKELIEERFPQLLAAVRERGVTNITPRWMEGNKGDRPAVGLVLWINRHDQDIKKKLWDRLVALCKEEGVNLVVAKKIEKKSPEQRVEEFLSMLRGMKGEWHASMVTGALKAETGEALRARFGTDGSGFSWGKILQLLPEDVAENFYYFQADQKLLAEDTLEREAYVKSRKAKIVRDLKVILQRERPERFNVSWILRQEGGLRLGSLFENIRAWYSRYTWYTAVKSVGPHWLKRFNYNCPMPVEPNPQLSMAQPMDGGLALG